MIIARVRMFACAAKLGGSLVLVQRFWVPSCKVAE